MQGYKKSTALGFEMYTLDLKAEKRIKSIKRMKRNLKIAGHIIATIWNKALDNAVWILGIVAIAATVYSMVLGFQLLGLVVQSIVGEDPHDAYQMEVVQKAIAKHRATIADPVTGAELPPYWTVEESY